MVMIVEQDRRQAASHVEFDVVGQHAQQNMSAHPRRGTLVHGGEGDRSSPAFLLFQAARTDSGRPRSSMRLSAFTVIWVSTSWAGPAWERSVSPITLLYRLIAASALAL